MLFYTEENRSLSHSLFIVLFCVSLNILDIYHFSAFVCVLFCTEKQLHVLWYTWCCFLSVPSVGAFFDICHNCCVTFVMKLMHRNHFCRQLVCQIATADDTFSPWNTCVYLITYYYNSNTAAFPVCCASLHTN